MRKRVPFIEQMEETECGLACIAMISAYYGQEITLHEIREKFGLSRGGSSLFHLMEIANEYGLEAKGYKTDLRQLINSPLPAIAHWEGKHYVVIEKVGRRKMVIVDPNYGKKSIRFEEALSKYTGYCLLLTPGDLLKPSKSKSNWWFFLSFVKKHPKWLIAILGVSLILQSFGVIAPQATAYLTDHYLLSKSTDDMPVIGFGLLSLFVFFELFSVLRGWFIAKLQSRMDLSMMQTFIDRLFKLPYAFFENRTGGDLLFRTNANVYIRQVLSNRLVTIIIDFILLVSYAVLMMMKSVLLGSIVIGIGIGIFILLIMTTMITKRFSSHEVTAQTKTQSFLTECIYGITDIKLLGGENQLFRSWSHLFRNQLQITEKRSIWVSMLDSFSSGIQFIMPLSLLWAGAQAVFQGHMTLGTLLGFNALAVAFMMPIVSLGSAYSQLQSVSTYLQRIQDVVEAKLEQPEGAQDVELLEGSIELQSVSFRYNLFSDYVLKDINLKIKPGEKVAIVGPSGSGKSTLAKLLLGFYKNTNGRILYDGYPIEQLDLRSLRRQMGAVLQDTKLFQRTVEENIKMLDDSISLEQVVQAAIQANIHSEIMKLPLGYSTLISESGGNVSGGQRQRLLLARALVNQPKILLLDEATSALDNVSEACIDKALSALNCTRLVIAHRLSTVINCDRIVVMNDGMIVETGTHQELLNKRGLYYKLYTNEEEDNNEIAI